MAVAGRVLMIPAGTWTSGTNYGMLDVVIYAGSSYVAKKQINNSTVAPPNAASDWQLLAQGYDVTNVVTKSMIANNFLATDPNTVLSGPMGKSLKDQLEQQNSNLALKANSSDLISKADKTDLKYQIIDLAGADLVTLPAGRWTVNNGVANGESGGWFAEVVEFDDAYRTLFACPYDDTKKYFYRAKRVFGTWRGWEKYTSVL